MSYTQQLYIVHAEQNGFLAQVSLDFVAKAAKSGRDSCGGKYFS